MDHRFSSFRGLKRNSLIYLLGGMVSSGGNILLAPIYVRYLDPSEYGVLNSIAIFTAFVVPVLSLGLGSAVGRYYFELHDKDEWRSFLGTVAAFAVFVGLLFGLSLSIFGGSWFAAVFPGIAYNPYGLLGIWIGLAGALAAIPMAVLQAQGNALKYRYLTTASFLLVACFMMLFVVGLRQGVLGALQAQLLAGSVMALYYLFYLIGTAGSLSFSLSYLKKALQFGLPITAYTIVGITTDISSRYLVQHLAGLPEFGVYSLALMYASILGLVASAINMAWAPMFLKQGLASQDRSFYSAFALGYILAMCFLGLILVLFARELISVFAPPVYRRAHEITPLLILANLFATALWTITANPLFLAKRTTALLWMTGISAFLTIVTGLWLIPKFGIAGAAVSLLLGNTVLVCISYFISQNVYRVAYEYKKIVLILILALAFSVFGLELEIENIWVLALAKVVLCFLFATLILVGKVVSMQDILVLLKVK